MKFAGLVLAAAIPFVAPLVQAQAGFLPANDARLRADVMLLVDEGVVSLPTNAWPLPVGDVAAAIGNVWADDLAEPALRAALGRVRDRIQPRDNADAWRERTLTVTAGEAPLLRIYGTPGRDELEVNVTGSRSTARWNVTLSATAVASPADGQNLRLDGSNLSLRWGNWLFSANQLDRWWGPGWDGSLILSTNARPMPAVSIDRLRSEQFDFPVLRWLGPWRFSAFLATMEQDRADVDRPLFMGMRASFKPAQILEFGLSRSAQFCGRDRPCGAKTFWNVLVGNDNAGLRVAPEDEPGNQMAGLDVRLVSPIRALPFALYGQFIGEDNSSNGIPQRYLGLLGLEGWSMLDSGAAIRWHLEYANTNCKFTTPTKDLAGFANCAYRQGIFYAGYRYRDRNIGHTTDADSESFAMAVEHVAPSGRGIELRLRRSLLDRYGGTDPFSRVTRGPGKLESAEVGWKGSVLGQSVSVIGGYERRDTGFADDGHFYGFLQWRHAL